MRKLALATEQSAYFAIYANYGFTLQAKHETAASYHFIATNVVNQDIAKTGIGHTILAHLDAQKRKGIIRRKVPEADRLAFETTLDEISCQSVHLSKKNSVRRFWGGTPKRHRPSCAPSPRWRTVCKTIPTRPPLSSPAVSREMPQKLPDVRSLDPWFCR